MNSPVKGVSFKRTLLKRALVFGLVALLGMLSALPNVLPVSALTQSLAVVRRRLDESGMVVPIIAGDLLPGLVLA
ncbi:MAG: hypothetical protein RQ757_09210 [Pseudomonadales bacterium]|nr:hypothetical protein [Pseudomonadales bacterium]